MMSAASNGEAVRSGALWLLLVATVVASWWQPWFIVTTAFVMIAQGVDRTLHFRAVQNDDHVSTRFEEALRVYEERLQTVESRLSAVSMQVGLRGPSGG